MLKSTVTLTVIALRLTSAIAVAAEGGSGSHGGDTLVIAFTATQANIANIALKNGPFPDCAMPAQRYSDLVKGRKGVPNDPQKIKVVSKPIVFVDGTEQDAGTNRDVVPILTELSRSRLAPMLRQNPGNSPQTSEADPRFTYAVLAVHEPYVAEGLETTNDSTRSTACVQAMIARGMNLEQIVAKPGIFHGLAAAYNEGRATLKCSSAIRGIRSFTLRKVQYAEYVIHSMSRLEVINSKGKRVDTHAEFRMRETYDFKTGQALLGFADTDLQTWSADSQSLGVMMGALSTNGAEFELRLDGNIKALGYDKRKYRNDQLKCVLFLDI